MKKEQKELLAKDLYGRLPYKPQVEIIKNGTSITHKLTTATIKHLEDGYWDVKPYLFPLSSLTDKQIFLSPFGYETMDTIRKNKDWTTIEIKHNDYYELTDWFNAHHFDYRGLIEKGLAINATNLGIYK